MKAKDCVDGQLYDIPCSQYYEAYKSAVCQGPNYNGKWMLFLVSNKEGERVTRTVMLDSEVVPSIK